MKSKVEEEEEEDEGGDEGQKGKRFIENLRRRGAIFVGHRSFVLRQPSTPAHISFNPSNPKNPSSRKLAASLWEFYQFYDSYHHKIPPPAKMHRHGKAAIRDNGLNFTDHQPENAGSARKQIGQMLKKHHHLVERNDDHALKQPISPSSYDSSLEGAPYNGVVTPGRRRRRRAGEPNYNLKSTTELLKVLNRIWSLEEQHSANISLIKSLKSELAHSQARIKELLSCKQTDRRDINDLANQLAEEKLSKETKEQDRLNSAIQSLEDERKMRKRSESLYRKMARELEEVKSTLSNCVKEIERGNKSKKIMERLCDEFAKGIKNYEKEIHGLKQKLDKNWEGSWNDEHDRMVLSIAESWIDERIQNGDDGSVLEKLQFEIETFLKSKQKKQIQESDSNCFELKKHRTDDVANKSEEKPEIPKPRRSPASLQVKFEDQMAWAVSKKPRAIEIEPESKETDNVVGEMIRTHHRRLLSEARETDEASCSYSRTRESPIRQWNSRNVGLLPQGGVKENNTLKNKLSEARAKSSKTPIRLFKS